MNADSWQVTLRGPASTKRLARLLGATLEPGTVVALVGELGAGKTSFVQGLAAGLGVTDVTQVVSPTYTLVNEYPGARATLLHLDFYRLLDAESARGLGLDEQIARRDAVVAIEWADHLDTLVPDGSIWVRLSHGETGGRRCEVRNCPKPKGWKG